MSTYSAHFRFVACKLLKLEALDQNSGYVLDTFTLDTICMYMLISFAEVQV